MKQKRKVKCLLPNKIEWRKNMLSALLFILSVVLCVGSVSLLTSCAWAADITFTGLDEKAEVLYEINFVKQNDARANISNMYVSGGNLYVTHAPLIVNTNVNSNQNTISNDKYGHILGGRGNNLYSKYVTLIGGYYNNIFKDNIVLLGGNNNSITGDLAVVIGGNNNKIAGTTSNSVIIGGNNHKIDNGSNHFILGGSGIAIEGQTDRLNKNIIFGGLKVQDRNSSIDRRSNIFAYSNSNNRFYPKTNNAFYLDVIGGVGFNRPSANEGLAVSGAVSIGEIDKNALCNENTLGVVGSYSSCLVGCTYASLNVGNQGARELLDLSNECKTTCKNWEDNYLRKKCLYTGENNNSINNSSNDYTSFCLTGNSIYNFDNTVLCDENKPNEYKNVVFEATLTGNCSSNRENICEYKCKEGYDLFKPSLNKYECIEGCDIKIDSLKLHLTHGSISPTTLSTTSEVYDCDSKCDEKLYICLTGTLYEYENETVGGQVTETNFFSTCKKFNCCDGEVQHGGTGTFYKTGSVMCNGACEGAEFTCDDGDRKNKDQKVKTNYPATGCSLEDQICEGYTITREQYSKLSENDKKNGEYTECTKYEAENNSCNENGKMYSLKCNTGYHQIPEGTKCESNYQTATCSNKQDNSIWTGGGTFTGTKGNQTINYSAGTYIVEYKGGESSANCPDSPEQIAGELWNRCWDHEKYNNLCIWECESGFSKRITQVGTYYCSPDPKISYKCIIEEDENRESRVRYDTGENLTENVTGTLFRDVIDAQKFVEDGGVCAYVCDSDSSYFNGDCYPDPDIDDIQSSCNIDAKNCNSPYYKTEGTGVVLSGEKWKCAVNSNTGGIKKSDYCYICDDGLTAYDGKGEEIIGGQLITKTIYDNIMCLKNSCNHCAYNGFPYCFPIDFTPLCSEGLWLRWERGSN